MMMNFFAVSVEKAPHHKSELLQAPTPMYGEYYGPIGSLGTGSKASNNKKFQQSVFEWVQPELNPHLNN